MRMVFIKNKWSIKNKLNAVKEIFKFPNIIVFLSLITAIITIDVAIVGILNFKMNDVKNEVEKIVSEFENINYEYFTLLKSINSFTKELTEYYDEDTTSIKYLYDKASSSLGEFKNLYIIAAILANRSKNYDSVIHAWELARAMNVDNPLCYYGLGLSYFKAFDNLNNQDIKNKGYNPLERNDHNQLKIRYLKSAIDNLSFHKLNSFSSAQYHIALANLHLKNYVDKNKFSYVHKAIHALNNTDKNKQPAGNVDYNLWRAYCYAGELSKNKKDSDKFKNLALEHFSFIRNDEQFKRLFSRDENCLKMMEE